MNILIFGGTTEGARLAKELADHGYDVTISVTTEYARNFLASNHAILVGRMDEPGIVHYLSDRSPDVVVDATHPHAATATRHISGACRKTRMKYLRLLRPASARDADAVYCNNIDETIRFLRETPGNIFLALGSKELEHMTRLEDFASRCHVRILPIPESLQKAIGLGFCGSKIICMQGPFDVETNTAMLSVTKTHILVTKESGDVGGLRAKIEAAKRCGCRVVVLERPAEEDGLTFDELRGYFGLPGGAEAKDERDRSFFPLFFNMKDKKVLIVGGGKVAERRAGILSRYGAIIRLISPSITDRLHRLAALQIIERHDRSYTEGDVERFAPFLTIAATNDRETNRRIAADAAACGSFVVVSDDRRECDCYFPALAESDGLLAGLISKDGDHRRVRIMAERIRGLFDENQFQ